MCGVVWCRNALDNEVDEMKRLYIINIKNYYVNYHMYSTNQTKFTTINEIKTIEFIARARDNQSSWYLHLHLNVCDYV